jgi:lysozyme
LPAGQFPCGAGGADAQLDIDWERAMLRTINDAGLNLIKSFEGCRLAAYQDVAGIWTIGYGHIRGVREGMTITEQQATQYLQEDLADTEEAVDWMTSAAPTTNNQYAAMVSLCFNIGSGNFKTSSVLRFHLARDYASAADAFLLWDKSHVDGQLVEVQGLLNRRRAERRLYLTEDAM